MSATVTMFFEYVCVCEREREIVLRCYFTLSPPVPVSLLLGAQFWDGLLLRFRLNKRIRHCFWGLSVVCFVPEPLFKCVNYAFVNNVKYCFSNNSMAWS